MRTLLQVLIGILFSAGVVLAQDKDSIQPDWVLLLLIFIITSAVAVVVGMVALIKTPQVADAPYFKDPGFFGEPVMTTYRQYPMEYNEAINSYPMSQRSGNYGRNYSEEIVTQRL